MKKKYYLYAGYHEMYISDRPLPEPLCLISTHRSVDAAQRKAEKEHPGDNYFYQTDLFPDDLRYILEESIDKKGEIPTATHGGVDFYIV